MAELLTKFVEDGGAAMGLPVVLLLFALRWLDRDRRLLLDELAKAEERERQLRDRERELLKEIAFLKEESERPTEPETPSARSIKLKSKPRI